MLPSITLSIRPHRAAPLLRRHPWVFSGALSTMSTPPPLGSLVTLVDDTGQNILGQGVYEGGDIAVRMVTFGQEVVKSWESYLRDRLEAALRMRQALGLLDNGERPTDTYRLCYGESDGLPGVIIDRYGSLAVLQIYTLSFYPLRYLIAQVLCSLPELGVQYVYDKSEGMLPRQTPEEWIESNGFLTPSVPTTSSTHIVLENGYHLAVDWSRGQKTGLFIDQRDNRLLVEQYAAGRRVLDVCCYSGAFSLYALGGGATEVVSIDSSARAIDLCRDTLLSNYGDDPRIRARHRSVVSDAFDFLAEVPEGYYDMIILDPPAFVKHRNHHAQGLSAYRRLNELALRIIASGGFLYTFSCSQGVSAEEFTLSVLSAAAQAGRQVQILHRLGQSSCHPVTIYHPESEYLTGLLLYVS